MQPDVIIRVRFKTHDEGGREHAIAVGEKPYGCPLLIGDDAFDCRILISDRTLQLGETYELPVKFLRPELALTRLSVGEPVRLWEGKEIAAGNVVRVV